MSALTDFIRNEREMQNRFSGNGRDRPAYLVARRKSDCQSDPHLAAHHGKSQRAAKHLEIYRGQSFHVGG